MVMLMACLQNRSMHNRSGGVWKIAWTGQGAELALGYCSSCSPSYSISISGLLPVIPSCEDHLLLQKGIFYRMGLVCCLGFCAFEYQFYVHCVWRERVELATVLQQSLISQWVTHTMSWASRGHQVPHIHRECPLNLWVYFTLPRSPNSPSPSSRMWTTLYDMVWLVKVKDTKIIWAFTRLNSDMYTWIIHISYSFISMFVMPMDFYKDAADIFKMYRKSVKPIKTTTKNRKGD